MKDSEVFSPANADEVQDFVRHAAVNKKTVLAIGNNSRRPRLRPNLCGDLTLSTSKFNQVHWLNAEDRTCEVDVGISPANLDSILAEHGLMVGVLGGGWQSGTLGGFFNSGEPSLLAGSCGFPRDQILGATWVLPDGSLIRSGARVVKSVAGYDVTRLFLSAGGQLAICLRLILRLRPRPKQLNWHLLPAQQKRDVKEVNPWVDFGLGQKRYAAWDGCRCSTGAVPLSAPEIGAKTLSEAVQILDSAQHWIAAPRRLDLDEDGGLQQEKCLLVDYLAHQSAWLERPSTAKLPSGCAHLPQAHSSRWLKAMRDACTP